MRLDKRRVSGKSSQLGRLLDQLETVKMRIRAKVENPFWVIER
jgi:hypothetical protein